jgi:tetratricopeptide (TPR) repeat protein
MRWPSLVFLTVLLAAPVALPAQSNPFDGLNSRGQSYSDPAVYAQHKAQWLARVQARPESVDVLEGAADFFMILDRPLAQELLERARDLEPDNPKWVQRLAHLHRLNAASGNAAEASLALSLMERAFAMDADQRSVLKDLPAMAFDAGDFGKARAYAEQLLNELGTDRNNWNYGDAVHKANLILGRIAVRDGRLADAVTLLRASGETPGSPVLDSFGPNMSLAKDLLERGETEAVLDYFELCRVFWKMGGSRLDAWTKDVQAGNIPNFGANLRY